jgi:hypothetical protein
MRRNLFLIPALAFVIKLAIIARIQGFDWFTAGNGNMVNGLTTLLDKNYAPSHVWYGADAENYLRSVVALFRDGFFSKEGNLYYWPAGYPILIWLVGFISQGAMLSMVAILQSFLYFVACAFFVEELRQSRLVNFSFPVALALSLNPTLALNTIAIGYELPTASLVIISIAALMRFFRRNQKSLMSIEFLAASMSMALASFMQPRLLVFAVALFLIWGLAQFPIKIASSLIVISLGVVLAAPTIMIFRNMKSVGFVAISTNLGTTMNIGAGSESTGGYTNKTTGVECPEVQGNPAQIDSARVKCVLKWYVNNPSQAARLFWNKTLYFWSPWYGPIANGTMARNPWRVNHPLNDTIKTQSGANLVFGNTGKLLSWLWLFATLTFLALGFRFLWSAGGIERLWGSAAFSMVVINWLSSIATIGDHRFRIPTMTLSLLLQTIGFCALFVNKRKRLAGPSVNIPWTGLHWKRKSETDNLQP